MYAHMHMGTRTHTHTHTHTHTLYNSWTSVSMSFSYLVMRVMRALLWRMAIIWRRLSHDWPTSLRFVIATLFFEYVSCVDHN